MFIAIDIGNTHTVIGAYTGETLTTSIRVSSTSRFTKNQLCRKVLSLLSKEGIDAKKIDGVGISSVVPKLTDTYITLAEKYFHRKPVIVRGDLNLGIKLHYDDPKSIGADRICSAVAGYTRYGGPIIIIDFGTATTYDIVASNGDFLGGVIAPGIATSAAALHRRTAQLPQIDLQLPENIINIDTITSIQAGILWGAIDAMSGMVLRLQYEIQQRESKKAAVVATGGFSKFIAEHSQVIQHVDASLVLDGIRFIFQRVHRSRKQPK
jgi:type III pantothenate kinase